MFDPDTKNFLDGWLEKKGGWDGQQFQPRFFVLKDSRLCYYRNDPKIKSENPRDVMDFKGSATLDSLPYSATQFAVISPKQKYILRAKNQEDKKMWVTRITQSMATSPQCRLRSLSSYGRTSSGGSVLGFERPRFHPLPGEVKVLELFGAQTQGAGGPNGSLIITNFQVFTGDASIPIASIYSVSGTSNRLILYTKNGQTYSCGLRDEVDVEVACRRLRDVFLPFAYTYFATPLRGLPIRPTPLYRYDPVAVFGAMGVVDDPSCPWKVDTEINRDYALCRSYPSVLCIPRAADTATLQGAAAFR
eukprot:RCo008153